MSSDESGVSPVVGVILVVAITVLLSAAIGVFILDLGQSASNMESTAEAVSVQTTGDGQYTVKLMSTPNADEVRVYISSDPSNYVTLDKTGEAALVSVPKGDILTVSAVSEGEERLVYSQHQSRSGATSASLVASGSATETLDGWYYADWTRRQAITVSNPNGYELENHQVELSVSYDSEMQSDFEDLRFTYVSSDGTETPIDHSVTSFSSGSSATVWIETPSVPANDNSTVRMYYKNPSATSASNSEATFMFYDGFSGSSMDTTKWDLTTSINGTTTVTNGYVELSAESTSDGTDTEEWTPKFNTNQSIVIEMAVNPQTAQESTNGFSEEASFIIGSGSGVSGETWYRYVPVGSRTWDTTTSINEYSQERLNGDSPTVTEVGSYAALNTWHDVSIDAYQASADNKTFVARLNGSVRSTESWLNTGIGNATLQPKIRVSAYDSGLNPVMRWDFYRVRKYADSPPTVSFGSEETQ